MKNRIIAVFLAFCVFAGAFSVSKRAHAAGVAAVSAVVSIGLIAWELLDLMIKGEEPGIVVAMRELIESGVDGLTNPDSYFQQTYGDFWKDYGSGYESIYNTVLEMYENGEIAIKNGKIDLTYEQFQEIYGIAYSSIDSFGLVFDSPYEYAGFDYNLGTPLLSVTLPHIDDYFYNPYGESYSLCLYDNHRVIFSDVFYLTHVDASGRYSYDFFGLQSNFYSVSIGAPGAGTISSDYYFELNPFFIFYSLSHCEVADTRKTFFGERNNCFVFENGTISYEPISSVDTSGCKSAIITSAFYGDFLKSLEGVKVDSSSAVDFDDLSTVLPVEESPVISFPVNPDLSVPIPDQVTVSVPGATDVPISEYFDPVLTDIKAPTGLASKFPFCIPFDFVRILGVLAADPIPPVIRIPLSTRPKNLDAFADNETIGDYAAPENPMFDIDEEIVIDFAHIPLVQPVCYTIFLVGFVIMLIKLTPKLIQH